MQRILLPVLLAFCGLMITASLPAQTVLFPDLKQKKKEHKNDAVVLDNGDRITGEIKRVEHGILYFKSDRALETIQFDWKRVRSVESDIRYEFETKDGKTYIGFLVAEPLPDAALTIKMENQESLKFNIVDVVEMHEMQESVLGRMSLSLAAGLNYTQGNNQTQINVEASLGYSRPKYSLTSNVNSLFSGQKQGINTSRHEFTIFGRRDFSTKWDYLAVGGLFHDSQQDLDLRTTLGGGFERSFSKTIRTTVAGALGFVYTAEKYTETADRNNGEILTSLTFSTYRFRSSELSGYILVFPSVTDPGRLRMDISAYWKWEIVKDVFWKVSGFDNFDNQPSEDFPKNLYGINTSIGWSF